MTGAPAVEFVAADLGYGSATVLRGVDLVVQAGEFLGAVGPSGSGKTTLIRALTGRARVLRGAVRIGGRPVHGSDVLARIGYVPQVDTADASFPITVEQVVLQGLVGEHRRRPWRTPDERRDVAELLEQLRVGHLARRAIGDLSGGELQRTLLARALVRRPELLLLDEPTSGVDLRTRHDVLHLLGELHGAGMTILITTHDLNFVAAHLPRIVCLAGEVVADGSPDEVFQPDVLHRTYGAEVRVIRDHGMVFVVDPTHILTPGQHHDEAHHAHESP